MADAARIGAAYDRLAAAYDRQLAADAWMRTVLHARQAQLFHRGMRVVDVGCGTGADTLYLAARGVRVLAVDASAGMVARLRDKVGAGAVGALVDVRVGDANDVLAGETGPFDGVVSSFAALNTLDLAVFAQVAARLVRPSGRVLAHMLSPGYFGARRGRATAAVNLSGEEVPHLTLPPGEVYRRYFQEAFVLRGAHALGLLPKRLHHRLPTRLATAVGRAEWWVGRLPALRGAGRFFVLELERRG